MFVIVLKEKKLNRMEELFPTTLQGGTTSKAFNRVLKISVGENAR